MRMSLKYKSLRASRYKLVIDLISNAGVSSCLRGSWIKGDFHVSLINGLSYSDVDFAVSESLLVSEENLSLITSHFVAAGFPLRVSTHEEKSLNQVSLEDWRVLKVCEYISKLPIARDDSNLISYWRAKTVLLLLQIEVDEGYKKIAARINTSDSNLAYAVKLGIESSFPVANATRLIQSKGCNVAHEFLAQCLLKYPSVEYIEKVKSQLLLCNSVNPWLQKYVLKKLSIANI